MLVLIFVLMEDAELKRKIEQQKELQDKIIKGLDLAYERLIEYKKQKNSVMVVMRDDKIVYLKPDQL